MFAKGQGISVLTLLALVITLIMYMVLLPVINPVIDTTCIFLNTNPNDTTSVTITLLRFVPFLVLAMIVISGFSQVTAKPLF